MHTKIYKPAACIGLVLAVFFFSCKKAEQYAQLVNDQPFVITGPIGLVPYNLPNYTGYQSVYMVGDTATLMGRFFLDKPGSQILVGGEAAKIVYSRKIKDVLDTTNQYTHEPNLLDYVRFAITPGMGLGARIVVSISANGTTIQAPAIAIKKFVGSSGKTDTTLVVDSITKWQPADVSYYRDNRLPLIRDMSTCGTGTICFNNNTGIYFLNGATITKAMNAGDVFADKAGSFGIKMFLGSVISLAGDTLTFSAEVNENSPDTAIAYIYRLCKMSIASKTITTINRTLLLKGKAAINGTPGQFEGNALTVPLMAFRLRTDANGNIYFVNHYAPPRSDFDATYYHDFLGGNGIFYPVYFGNPILRNICRVDAGGQVSSICSYFNPGYGAPLYAIPGFPCASTADYLISPDGANAFAMNKANTMGDASMGKIDIRGGTLVASTGSRPVYLFYSFDPSPVTGRPNGSQFQWWFNPGFPNFVPLPNGDILFGFARSIAALNLENQTGYCYAGTEAGFTNYAVPGQVNTTGKVKWVRFEGWSIRFAGLDKSGAVYYCYGSDDYQNGLTFYKMSARK